MRFGVYVPNIGDYANPHTLIDLARDAETAGWDGFFIWDHIQSFDPTQSIPVVDPWIALSAVAVATTRIRLGPLITPLARRRPWKLARETVSLDHLSGGRLILGAGLGHPPDADFAAFGEESDERIRARKLDEGLDVLTGLWRAEPFSYQGKHIQVYNALFAPPPLQQPRIPIWVGGLWPHPAPFRRAARWDGVIPGDAASGGQVPLTPEQMRAIARFIAAHRSSDAPFDLVHIGETPGERPAGAATVAPYAEAGVTWWLESLHGFRGPLDAMRDRIRKGPPRA